MSDKPLKPKPQFYAVVFPALQDIAKQKGYNLILHGSLNRDLDLIAVQWEENAESHESVLREMEMYLNGYTTNFTGTCCPYNGMKRAGNRTSYHIDINRNGKYNGYIDAEYYIDINFV